MPTAKCVTRTGAARPAQAPAKSAGCYPLGTVVRRGGVDWESKNVRRGGKTYRQWVRVPGAAGGRTAAKKGPRTPATPPRQAVALGMTTATGRDGRPYELRKSPDGKRYRWYLLKDGAAPMASAAAGPAPEWQQYLKTRNVPKHCADPTRGREGTTARPIVAPGCVKRGKVLPGQLPGTYWKSGVDSANRPRWIKMEDAMAKPVGRNGRSARKPLLGRGGVNYAEGAPVPLASFGYAGRAEGEPRTNPADVADGDVWTGTDGRPYRAVGGRWVPVGAAASAKTATDPSPAEKAQFDKWLNEKGYVYVTGDPYTGAYLKTLPDPFVAGAGAFDEPTNPSFVSDGYNWYGITRASE